MSRRSKARPVCTGSRSDRLGENCCNRGPPYCEQSDIRWYDAEDMMLHTDIGLYLDFTVDETGKPVGCPGLDAPNAWRARNGKESYKGDNPDCQLNNIMFKRKPMHEIVREYSENNDRWYQEFPLVLKKMLRNGYKKLKNGPDVFNGVECIAHQGKALCERASK